MKAEGRQVKGTSGQMRDAMNLAYNHRQEDEKETAMKHPHLQIRAHIGFLYSDLFRPKHPTRTYTSQSAPPDQIFFLLTSSASPPVIGIFTDCYWQFDEASCVQHCSKTNH